MKKMTEYYNIILGIEEFIFEKNECKIYLYINSK